MEKETYNLMEEIFKAILSARTTEDSSVEMKKEIYNSVVDVCSNYKQLT